jgi:hypothetical protein
VLRAIGWFKPYPYKIEIASDIEGAIAIATALLDKEGLAVPTSPQLEKLRAVY